MLGSRRATPIALAVGSLLGGACRLPTVDSCAGMSRMEDVLFCVGTTTALENASSGPKECRRECPRGQICDRDTGVCEPAPEDPPRPR